MKPGDSQTLYAVTLGGGGVFRTTNGGADWTAINTGLPSKALSALAIDPITPDTIYMVTNFNGVYKSINGGTNWSFLSDRFTNQFVLTLAVDPLTPQTLYAGTNSAGSSDSHSG